MYALALIADGRKTDAHGFIKQVMSLDGIINSPNGQPAMYEYRNGNPNDPAVYGRVDKPQFLWAGGWYLYSLYNLLGVRENVWNLSFDPWLAENMKQSDFTIYISGKPVDVTICGQGDTIKRIAFDGVPSPTAVVPQGFKGKTIDIVLGDPGTPYVSHTESMLDGCRYDPETMKLVIELRAFPGHASGVEIVSPRDLRSLKINGEESADGWRSHKKGGLYRIHIDCVHQDGHSLIEAGF
jgi:hypothetical protein